MPGLGGCSSRARWISGGRLVGSRRCCPSWPIDLEQGPPCLSRYWRRGPAATSTTPAECPTKRAHRRRIRPHRCRGIHHHHKTVCGVVPVADRPLHTNHRLAHIRRLPLRDVRVRVHDRNRDAPGESGWAWHHLPQVLHEEQRRCQRMPDLRPSPPGPANGEPLAPLEFGIRHTGSATIDGDDSIEDGTRADGAGEETGRCRADSDEACGSIV
jgi:hypothetical protein